MGPDADPGSLALEIEGADVLAGADGTLALRAGGVEIRVAAPAARSLSDAELPDLKAALAVDADGRVAFDVSGREEGFPLSMTFIAVAIIPATSAALPERIIVR